MFVQFERREFLNFRNSHKRVEGGNCTICLSNLKGENSSTLETATRGWRDGGLHHMFVQFERREFLNFRNSHKRVEGGNCTICLFNLKGDNSSTLETATRGWREGIAPYVCPI